MRNFEQRHEKENIPVYTVVVGHPLPPKPPQNFFPEHIPHIPKGEVPVMSREVAPSALRLEEARRISFSGDVVGVAIFDGSEDVEIATTVKTADRAVKDGRGNEISKSYARKSELEKFVTKEDLQKKINYLEKVLHATKEAVNDSIRREDLSLATVADIDEMFGE